MTNATKAALEASLKKLLLKKPLDKITINDLTTDCGISRMAFYYHFKDIYDLVEWSCLEDATQALQGKKEPEKTTVYYVTDEVQQSQYINMFRSQGMDAVILKHNIDSAFITHAERYNEHVTFQRIDADLTNDMKDESGEDLTDATNTLTDLFRKVLDKKDLTVKVENLKDENVSSMVTLSEESRRMQDMMKMYGMDANMFGGANGATLVLNANHPLVKYVAAHKEDDKNVPLICQQLYDLAMMAHKQLSPDEMTQFIARSNQILLALAK